MKEIVNDLFDEKNILVEMLVESDDASEPPVKQPPPACHTSVLEGDADESSP